MSNLLIVGKDLPDSLDFAESFSKKDRIVFTSLKQGSEYANFESENIYCTTVNRASAISAHSFILNAETKIQSIDEVLFIFDAQYFQNRFPSDNESEISTATDTMINSYIYFTTEILKRIDQCKEKVTVSFLLKSIPSKLELLQSSSKINLLPLSNIITIAQNAFISIAENFSTNIQDKPYLSVLLAKVPAISDAPQSDLEIGNWLCAAFDSLKNAKHQQTLKAASTWNKVGSKISSGFSLFK